MAPRDNRRTRNVGEAVTCPPRRRPPAEERLLARSRPTRKRNRLDLDVYREPGRFFITITTHDRVPWFKNDDLARSCIAQLRAACERHRFTLLAFCFMPDHVHVLVTCEEEADLVRFVKDFKQRTGWWFRNEFEAGGLKASPTPRIKPPPLWQRSYYDHILRRDEDINDVIRYILENPIRVGLATSADEYAYAWSAAGLLEPVS